MDDNQAIEPSEATEPSGLVNMFSKSYEDRGDVITSSEAIDDGADNVGEEISKAEEVGEVDAAETEPEEVDGELEGEVEEFFVDLNEAEKVTVKIGDKEYTKAELEEHKNGYLRQQDATKKWQAASDLNKEAQAKADAVDAQSQALAKIWDKAKAAISEWDEEAAAKIESELGDTIKTLSTDKQAGYQKAVESFAQSRPEWVLDNKLTKEFETASNLTAQYMRDNGINDTSRLTDKHLSAFYEAALYRESAVKTEQIKKKVKKLPIRSTKPKAQSKPAPVKKNPAQKLFAKSISQAQK